MKAELKHASKHSEHWERRLTAQHHQWTVRKKTSGQATKFVLFSFPPPPLIFALFHFYSLFYFPLIFFFPPIHFCHQPELVYRFGTNTRKVAKNKERIQHRNNELKLSPTTGRERERERERERNYKQNTENNKHKHTPTSLYPPSLSLSLSHTLKQ